MTQDREHLSSHGALLVFPSLALPEIPATPINGYYTLSLKQSPYRPWIWRKTSDRVEHDIATCHDFIDFSFYM